MIVETAAHLVARHLAGRPASEHPQILRALLSTAAAGLVALEGDRATAEYVFRVADAVVSMEST